MATRITGVSFSEYENHPALPKSPPAVSAVIELFRVTGCAIDNVELLNGGDDFKIRSTLSRWFSETNDDTLILFWAGHGVLDGDHFLVCSNSPAIGISSFNSLRAEDLGDAIAKSGATRVLVILDTCHSGAGAGNVAGAFASVLSRQLPVRGIDPTISVIASCHALEKSVDGQFFDLMKKVLEENGTLRNWRDTDQFLTAYDIANAVKAMAEREKNELSIFPVDAGGGRDFIPNPRFRLVVGVEDVETRRAIEKAPDGIEHFDIASKGIEVGETGWYFTGRTRLLRKLTGWLENADQGVSVVTGPPGAGKSAVVGRIVTLSDPVLRQAAERAGILTGSEESIVPPEDVVDIAIHAKGKTLDDCWYVVMRGLGLDYDEGGSRIDVEAVLLQIEALDRRLTIIVDALDEAARGQGAAIARNLIVPLGRLGKVRVLVGTRRSFDGAVLLQHEDRHSRLRKAFGDQAIIHDLADEDDTTDDIMRYARARLSTGRHAGNKTGIEKMAREIADKAGDVFLYARVVSRTLQERESLETGMLPEGAMAAFENDLKQRFAGHEERISEMLFALAFGIGSGFSRRAWTTVATALSPSGSKYLADDVTWTLAHAGWHIIEASVETQGATHGVYRLVHQAFNDHFQEQAVRRFGSDCDIQALITQALIGGIEGRRWLCADRYLWRHLADHAARGGILERLVGDPGYLAVAEPGALLSLLHTLTSDQARQFSDIYVRSVDRLHGLPPEARMPYIHMVAQMERPDLAGQLEPPISTVWRSTWARCLPTRQHQVLDGHKTTVTSVVFGQIGDRPVIVSGSKDRTVRLWDAQTGVAIGAPLEGHEDAVNSVAFGRIGDRPVIASGSDDMTVRLWDAQTGDVIGAPIEGNKAWYTFVTSILFGARLKSNIMSHKDSVTSVAFGQIGDRPVVASGSKDKTARLWDAQTGAAIGAPLKSKTKADFLDKLLGYNAVNSVAIGLLGDRPVIVTGSRDTTVQLWDGETRKAIGAPLEGHNSAVRSVIFGVIGNRPAIVSGSVDGTVRFWNAEKGEAIGRPIEVSRIAVTSLAFGQIGERHVIASGSNDKIVRIWDPNTGEVIGAPFVGHEAAVTSVAFGQIGDHPVIASGSEDRTVRLWNAETGEAIEGLPETLEPWVSSAVFGMIGDRPVIASGGEDMVVRLWDAETGELNWASKGHLDRRYGWSFFINNLGTRGKDLGISVAFGQIGDRPVIVSSGPDATIRLWNAETGEASGRPIEIQIHESYPTSVSLGQIGDRSVIVSGSRDGTVRLWNAETGEAIGAPFEGHSSWVNSINFDLIGDRPVIASGSRDGTVCLWDARAGEAIRAPLEGHRGGVTSVAFGRIGDSSVIASGSDDMTVRLWDAQTGDFIGAPMEGHKSGVSSVAFGRIGDSPVIASASDDSTVRLWDALTGEAMFSCETGSSIRTCDINEKGQIVLGLHRGLISLEISRNVLRQGVF